MGVSVEPRLGPGLQDVYCISTRPSAPALGAGVVIPLSLTLVWTDPPSTPQAAFNLVNDLDLIVQVPAPLGPLTAYGNNCQAPQVSPPFDCSGNATAVNQVPDTINNVEHIVINAPGALTFTVIVRGSSVPVSAPQPYSLVATGPGLLLTTPQGGICVAPP